ncbi:protein ripply1 [Oxyura jamaicensis]|uniref:protein ripply1 n=1 Tax=Oxyura jamaicensis TaxID=8884 RepID=UPI0015A60946|nr:protein ripply1 [Oxyura jamaicensis]
MLLLARVGTPALGCRASAATVTKLLSSPRPLPLWRPWLPREEEEATGRQRERTDTAQPLDVSRDVSGDSDPSKALALFHHPVRLLWPRSKSFDYLYGVGERLLRDFPVQATLCLYDDSGSEEEEEEEDEEDNDDEDNEEDDEEEEGETGGAVPVTGAGSWLPAAGSARPV